jgi:hypothetical protein
MQKLFMLENWFFEGLRKGSIIRPKSEALKSRQFRISCGILLGLFLLAGLAFFSVPRLQGEAHQIVALGSRFMRSNFRPQDNPNAQPFEIRGLTPAMGPLQVDPANPRYFTDGSGKAILLVGSHTWDNRQDQGSGVFDWTGYLDSLQTWGHNFIRLWVWEQAKNITTGPDPVHPNTTLTPEIFARTGPGNANDGGLKFDLTQYNLDHFDRLRQRIIEAGNRGIYVSVMLFDGWSVALKAGGSNPWIYHPFNAANNINGIDGDPNSDGNGYETENLSDSNITALQEAYVEKVIDTVNDLDNVLYEISNEPDGTVPGTVSWVNHMIDYIHTYESTKPKQHPVWFTVPYPGGDNQDLLDSGAEAISPNSDVTSDGSKVVIADTDHYFGIGGDANWAWQKFCQGYNLAYMDSWDNQFLDVSGLGHPDQNFRDNLGWIRAYANRMNLAAMAPHGELASSGYALANPVATEAEYLVYLPDGGSVTVDLTATSGTLNVEWFNPGYGTITSGGTTTGGSNRLFSAPFGGSAVLYIFPSSSMSTPTPTNASTTTSTPTLVPTLAATRTPTTTPINEELITSGVTAYPLDTSALVTWKTNKPATGRVDYGISPALSTSTRETLDHVTMHSLLLSDLIPATTYVYRVYSQDPTGNSTTSSILEFSTLSPEEVKRVCLPIIVTR